MAIDHKLAAIIFADIAGYTAVMQLDEVRALDLLGRFKKVLEEITPEYQGRIVQFFGDGCLLSFDSSSSSVECAVALQIKFIEAPQIPVRMGLHLGDVVFKDENIFGDGVNIASRIESIGIPGSILLSKAIRDQIKNQAEFNLVSLGSFDFKNVTEPVEVFSLANPGFSVPKRDQMHGKLKDIQNEKSVSNFRSLAKVTFLILALIAVGYLTRSLWSSPGPLSSEVRKARVAILPFENKTNDPSLEMLGPMAADWISQSLLAIKDVKVVMYQTTQEHLGLFEPATPTNRQIAFAERTGAEKIIRGTYYLQNEKVILQSQLLDARSGEVEVVLPEIEGSRNDLQSLVREIGSRFAGYYESRGNINFNYTVPTIEAYSKLREVLPVWGNDLLATRRILAETIRLDSGYLQPYQMLRTTFTNARQWKEADSMQGIIEKRFTHPNPFEHDIIKAGRAIVNGDIPGSYTFYKQAYERDPKNLDYNIWAASTAQQNWKYADALEIYHQIDPSTVDYDVVWNRTWVKQYAWCLLRLNYPEKASGILRHVRERYLISDLIALSYIELQQYDSLVAFYANLPEESPRRQQLGPIYPHQLDLPVIIAERFAIRADTSRQLAWAVVAAAGYNATKLPVPARVYYLLKDYPSALKSILRELKEKGRTWDRLSQLACIHARMGQAQKALKVIQEIESMRNAFTRGEDQYALAEIFAALGEKEKAVKCMKRAFQEGRGNTVYSYNADADFAPLIGYAPFDMFVSARN